jgi:hypothetical protein
MNGDIGYTNTRFSKAVSYLALTDGSYRERLQRAVAEAMHAIDYDNPRPIPDELRGHIEVFFGGIRPVDQLTDEEAQELGVDLLSLASDVDVVASQQHAERSAERYRSN